MKAYLILTPPGGPEADHRSTQVLKDSFSWSGFLLSWIWLFWHRLWLTGAVVLVLQIVSGVLLQMPGYEPIGLTLGLALSLLVGLEGRHYLSEALIRRGWVQDAVVVAQDLDTAEEIYFSGLPATKPTPMPSSSEWASQTKGARSAEPGSRLGLFDYGGR